MISDTSIRRKLTVFFVLVSIIPLLLVGYLGSQFASSALMDKSFDQLQAVQSLRKRSIERAIASRITALKGLAERNDIVHLFSETAAYREDLRVEESEPLPVKTTLYRAISERYTTSLLKSLSVFGLRDLYLVSALHGQVVFSLAGDEALGSVLDTGPLRESGLAEAWRRVAATRRGRIIDYSLYSPDKSYSAFLAEPFFNRDGIMAGVIILRMGPELIDSVLSSREGMGQTGESYLVSYDAMDNRWEFRSTIQTTGAGRYAMGVSIPPRDYWNKALYAADTGVTGVFPDVTKNPVLASSNHLMIPDLDWFLVSKIDRSEVVAPIRNMLINMVVMGGTLALIATLGVLFFSAGFTDPIIRATEFARQVAAGRFDVKLKLSSRDELGVLTQALNVMAERLRVSDWLRTGSESLSDVLRGEHPTEILADRVLDFLVEHCSAAIGALYLSDRDDPHTLVLTARHAWSDHDANRLGRVAIGDGLVGQAAADDGPTYLATSDETAGTPVLDYGAGMVAPTHLAAVPLSFEESVLGVLILGTFHPFDDSQRRFLADNASKIAMILAAARSRQTIESLLLRAQAQEAELRASNTELEHQTRALLDSERELQTQQEELRVINEELEEQAQALRKSESELQSQQEELRVTNEELEERTRELEDRAKSIDQKNRELTQARDEIRQKVKDLETASRYKSEFLANMSHELRTPLNSILILSQLLGENRGANLLPRQVESARTINSAGTDLLKLINDILDLSKVEAGKIELVNESMDLAAFVEDVKRVFVPISETREVRFEISLGSEVPAQLVTDSHRLQQVIRNLLSNAFKFTDGGGTVSLTIARPQTEDLPEGCKLVPESAVAFAVKDSGIGIPADRQKDVFEAFRQADGGTSRKYGGTGLGLSISRNLVELLGGVITLVSAPGKGSTFTVILPERSAAAVSTLNLAESAKAADVVTEAPDLLPGIPAAESKAQPAAARGKGKKAKPQTTVLPQAIPAEAGRDEEVPDDRKSIVPGEGKVLLIIEDDSSFATIVRDLARERGFKCLVAHEGETGLHFADYFRPNAIILDVGLPGIDGWAVMARLKDNPATRHIPVHFISGSDQAMAALRMGAVGFLGKPASLENLQAAFSKIEEIISKPVSSLLVVEDDPVQSESIRQLIGNHDVVTTLATSGAEALDALAAKPFDCMILDLGLRDMTGFELLEKMRERQDCSHLPIVVYTGRELTKDEEATLKRYADSIIVKGVRSPERLLDETALFLHRVEASLPEKQRSMIRMVHDRDEVFKDKTILLVDDDMRNVFALSSVLEDKGLAVVIARNGKESLDLLEAHPETDLILMDIMMPEMDGYDATRAIRKIEAHAKLPIIALTAKAMKGDRNKCIEAGASDYLAKPIDSEKLLSLLRVWLYK